MSSGLACCRPRVPLTEHSEAGRNTGVLDSPFQGGMSPSGPSSGTAQQLFRRRVSDGTTFLRLIEIETDGMPDHVHVFLRLKPDLAVSELVRHLKGGSSKWVHEQGSLSPEFAWQSGYAAFSVSESKEETVRSYIRKQESHHRRATFKEELIGLLRKHRIEFDPVYVFD